MKKPEISESMSLSRATESLLTTDSRTTESLWATLSNCRKYNDDGPNNCRKSIDDNLRQYEMGGEKNCVSLRSMGEDDLNIWHFAALSTARPEQVKNDDCEA
ncbi:hypothetical protein TNCV_3392291 [Trichonephila clavipes]|nr:hypothetical protein TNCV_3392291 [Trichonephila clavipes]